METLLFMEMVQLIQRIKGCTMQMLIFIETDLFPGGKTIWKDQPSTVKPILHRMGIQGSSEIQRVGGSESGCPRGEEGGVMVGTTGGGEGSAISGEGERFRLGENEGREEGSYRSSESTREKMQG